MATVNKVFLIGNLTRDPELRATPQGVSVCEFALALNRAWTSKTGEKKEEVAFIDVVVWDRQAENCKEFLRKGRQCCVEGRLTQDRWDDKNTGQKRSKIRVTAERVTFLGGGPRGDAAAPAGAPPDEESPPPPPMDEEVGF
jgi:single-strand DNA-binding protein